MSDDESRTSDAASVEEVQQILESPDRATSLSVGDLVRASELAWRYGRIDLGVVAMRILVERQPLDARMHHRLADFLFSGNQPVEAEQHCVKAIELEPGFEPAYLSLRHMRTTRGDFEGAVEVVRAQERHCGANPTLSFAGAQLLFQAGKLEDALATIRRVNDVGPPTEESLLFEAELAHRLELPHVSRSAAERAHRLWPDSAAACSMLARLLSHAGQYQMAVPVLRHARKLLSRDPYICHLLAVSLTATGEIRAALESALMALELKPDEPEFHFLAASLHDRLGETKQAVESMRQGIALEPDRAHARLNLAHMLSRYGAMEEAIAELTEAERISPDERIRDLRLSWLGRHDPVRNEPTPAGMPVVLRPMPRAHRQPPAKSAIEAFVQSLVVQSRVVAALVMREFRHRAAHSRFGLLTVFIPVALQVVTLGVVLSVFNHGRAPIGDHLFFFYATGVMPFYLFIHVIDHSQNMFLDNTKVLEIPVIRRLDLILAASFTELLIITATIVVTFGVFALMDYGPRSSNQIEAVYAILAVWFFSVGLGLICAVMTNIYRPFAHGWFILQRFLYFLSGVFFIPLQMPVWVREPLSWNPLLQGIEWFRTGFFERYDPPWLDKAYLLGAGFACVVVGLMLERALRRKMRTV